MGRLANNDGEQCLSRVANSSGIPYIVSANASISFEELASNSDTQTMMYQVYINKDRKITEAILLKVKAAGYRVSPCISISSFSQLLILVHRLSW